MQSGPEQAYRPVIRGNGIAWTVDRPGLPGLMLTEPEARHTRRILSWLVGHLPIRRYL